MQKPGMSNVKTRPLGRGQECSQTGLCRDMDSDQQTLAKRIEKICTAHSILLKFLLAALRNRVQTAFAFVVSLHLIGKVGALPEARRRQQHRPRVAVRLQARRRQLLRTWRTRLRGQPFERPPHLRLTQLTQSSGTPVSESGIVRMALWTERCWVGLNSSRAKLQSSTPVFGNQVGSGQSAEDPHQRARRNWQCGRDGITGRG